jgi:mitogen-activated protein kinase 15
VQYTVLHYTILDCTVLTFIYAAYVLYILHINYTGEMLNGRPVFPGTSTMNQIERVIQVTQMPSKADIEAVASPFAATMLETLPVMNYKTIPQTFPSATEDGLDVLRSCFHFNPDKRPSAEELLRHDFVSDFHNEEEEPNFPGGEELKFLGP